MPITAQLSNFDSETASAQLQVFQSPAYGTGATFYARPVSVAQTRVPQTFTLVTRDVDPVRDEATVRLMTDGHVVAETRLADASGTSIGEGDLLLVGLGGDASTFSFLDGQSWNVAHSPGGPNTITTMAGMPQPHVRIASASLKDLPDREVGYSGVDAFLLRSDAPLDSLTEAQTSALKSWVASGGELIVCAGSDPSRFDDPFFSDLLPADVTPNNTSVTLPDIGMVSCVTLRPKSTHGAQTFRETPSGRPLAVSGAYGAGHVVLTAFDPTTLPFRSWSGAREQAFWQDLLLAGRHRSLSVLGYVAYRQERTAGGFFRSSFIPYLSHIVLPQAGTRTALVRLLVVFFTVYILVVIPISYWLLKRLKKREWAWRVIPGFALIFAVVGFCLGYAVPGGVLSVNRASFVETSSGQHLAGSYQEVGVTANYRTTTDIVFPTPTGAIAASRRVVSRVWRGRRGDSNNTEMPQTSRLVQTESSIRLEDTVLTMGGTRALDAQAILDLGGSVDGTLTLDASHKTLTGTVINHLPVTLSHGAVYYANKWTPIADLKSEQSTSIAVIVPSLEHRRRFSFPGEELTVDLRRSEMSRFMESLSFDTASPYGGRARIGYEPNPNEALFIAWSDDSRLAGPTARVNDKELPTNDTTLLIVHIPVNGNTRSAP